MCSRERPRQRTADANVAALSAWGMTSSLIPYLSRRAPKGHAHPRGNRPRFQAESAGGLEAKKGQDIAHGLAEQIVIRLFENHARDVDSPDLVHHEAHDDLTFACSRAEQRVGEAWVRHAPD